MGFKTKWVGEGKSVQWGGGRKQKHSLALQIHGGSPVSAFQEPPSELHSQHFDSKYVPSNCSGQVFFLFFFFMYYWNVQISWRGWHQESKQQCKWNTHVEDHSLWWPEPKHQHTVKTNYPWKRILEVFLCYINQALLGLGPRFSCLDRCYCIAITGNTANCFLLA